MEQDPELDQVICSALSLQDDYPNLYLPTSHANKAATNRPFSELQSDLEIQIPVKSPKILQDTLVELYSILGIQPEARMTSTVTHIKQEEPSPTTCTQDQLHVTTRGTAGIKRPLPGEKLESSKRIKEEVKELPPSSSSQKCRKRTLYNKQQTIFLQKQFDFNPYPDYVSRCCFSQMTGIPEPRIQVWFQNRRARYLTKPTKPQETPGAFTLGRRPSFPYRKLCKSI
ncbi:homeobox protein siamois-like [Gastrophryne carolinensis]